MSNQPLRLKMGVLCASSAEAGCFPVPAMREPIEQSRALLTPACHRLRLLSGPRSGRLRLLGLCLLGLWVLVPGPIAAQGPVPATGNPGAANGTAAGSPGKIDPQHPLAPALDHAYKARDAVAQLTDYEAIFAKREVVDNRLKTATMQLKLRKQPFSVYLRFQAPNEGREVIYVSGANNNQLLAHDTGLRAIAGTVSLNPTSADAMEDNRYPITMIGLENMLNRVIAQWEAEGQFGEVAVKYYPNAKLGPETECKVIESTHPQPRKQFKFQMTRLYIEKSSGLPVRVEQYGFPVGTEKPPLLEEYTYTKVRTNLGLVNADFDVRNPNYAFP